MLDLPGYSDGRVLSEGPLTTLVDARAAGGGRVWLKVLREEMPDPTAVARLRHEAELLGRLEVEGVPRAKAVRRIGARLGFELEHLEADTLADWLGQNSGGLLEQLEIAVRLAGILDGLHRAGVIHKNVAPEHVLIDRTAGAVRLVEFGIATELASEAADLAVGDDQAAAEYMSPEQTGRMNRSVDHRSDLYSLGATLYHLFTGRAPFDVAEGGARQDRIALVHAHIARRPTAPHEVRRSLPPVLSDLVLRLLEKDVESRYQSAFGVLRDLVRCRDEVAATGRVTAFGLGEEDLPDELVLTERLFGRERERSALLDGLEHAVAGASELVLVHGSSGVGKSRLVGELQRPVAIHHGHYAEGKVDQYFADQPYGPFVMALRGLVRRLLATSEAQLEVWRERLAGAVGRNGQLVVEAIPELELLLGPQPEPDAIGGAEAQNRFLRTMVRFIGALARPEHPLVLVLDDLQWADSASLDLLGALLEASDLGHVLIVGAYRDNEVDAVHPLTVLLEDLAATGVEATRIELGPLAREHVGQLIAAALRQEGAGLTELVELVVAKTEGNPFFVNEFLTALHEDGLLHFDRSGGSGEWRWKVAEIEARDYTQNVVDLVTHRLERLPEAGRELVALAACVGPEIDLALLAELRGAPRSDVADELWPVLRDKLLLPVNASYLLERFEQEGAPAAQYRFMHDRVQQAAYGLLAADARRETHLRIGRIQRGRGEPEGGALFDVVSHLNEASSLIDDADERRDLAALNLRAGRQARAAGAFAPALALLEQGLELLPDEPWVNDPELSVDLHTSAAEAAYLTHRFERMSELSAAVIEHATSVDERLAVREIEIRALIAQERRPDALAIALPLLAELGTNIPGAPEPADYGAGFGAAEEALAGRPVATLADLSAMTDPRALASTRLLARIFSVAYFAAPQLLPLIIAKLVELSARHGNSGESAFGYTLYGLHLCAFADEIERGYEFGQLSLAVLDRTDSRPLRAQTLFILSICVTHWKEPIHRTLEPLLEAYQSGLETGDLEYSTHALMIRNQALLAIGHDLADLSARMQSQRPAVVASKEDAAVSLFSIYQQVVANWRGEPVDPVLLSGEHHDEEAMLAQHQRTGDQTSLFHIFHNKLVLAYSFGRFDEARELAGRTREQLPGAVGVHQIPAFHFYESLAALHELPEDEEQRRATLEAVRANQERLAHWADHCPETNRHRWHLVEAELAVHGGALEVALDHFERATELARENGYPQESALAHERHARLWIGRGKPEIARAFVTRARHAYELWGAAGKVTQLDEAYSDLLASPAAAAESETALDVESVLKAAEALSGIRSLDELVGVLMDITIENAGAHRGVLFLPHKGRLVATAAATANEDVVALESSADVHELDDREEGSPFCSSVVRFVHRSGEAVVVDDAARDERFGSNPYFARSGVRSVLCLPLLHKSNLAAVVYLENDLTRGAFTSERLELLRLLSGQMAVSVENVQAYENLQSLNRAYERFVPSQFLGQLGRGDITEVDLGDQVATDMSVMFLDIRGFTRLSEQLSSRDIFALLNGFLGRIEPVLARHGGFVDKYTGDGLMALFPESADGAVAAAIEILRTVDDYNVDRASRGRRRIEIGIGIDTGELMLGTVGSESRMDGTVISSVVNLASRIETLNKTFGTRLLISGATRRRLTAAPGMRELGEARAKGGVIVEIFDVFEADPSAIAAGKARSAELLAEAMQARRDGQRERALELLRRAAEAAPHDATLAACLREAETAEPLNPESQ